MQKKHGQPFFYPAEIKKLPFLHSKLSLFNYMQNATFCIVIYTDAN